MVADHYQLVTLWRLDAPVEQVWQVLSDAGRWPDWWPLVEAVEEVDSGDANGQYSIWRYTWKTMLPYKLRIELCVTRIVAPVLLEADVRGDLAGHGVCRIYREGDHSLVRYEWNVRTCRSWMKWLGPIGRPVFLWNHHRVMKQGGEQFAARLARGSAKATA